MRFVDISNQKFGRLTAISVNHTHHGRAHWLCKCDCGNKCVVSGANLRKGASASCGCLQRELAAQQNTLNLKGQRFGKLVVVEKMLRPRMYKNRDQWWLCKCDCGGMKRAAAGWLKAGTTRSCGCLLMEVISLPPGEASFNRLLRAYRHGAAARKIEFHLTKKEFRTLTQKNCYLCGIPPLQVLTPSYGTSNGDFVYNGIDRADSEVGYTIDNCRPCCKSCNFAKGTLSMEEFLQWVSRISNYQKNLGNIEDA